jgi:hypothetical protein
MYRKGPKPSPPQGCLWIEQAATYLGLKVDTLRKWRLLGKGPVGFKVGGYVAYKTADLDAYLESQYQAAITPTQTRIHEARPAEPRTSRKPARAAA